MLDKEMKMTFKRSVIISFDPFDSDILNKTVIYNF